MVRFNSGFYRSNPILAVPLPYRYYTLEKSFCRYEAAEVLLSFAMAISTASSCSRHQLFPYRNNERNDRGYTHQHKQQARKALKRDHSQLFLPVKLSLERLETIPTDSLRTALEALSKDHRVSEGNRLRDGY
jgi:hypothetical protein